MAQVLCLYIFKMHNNEIQSLETQNVISLASSVSEWDCLLKRHMQRYFSYICDGT